MSIVEPCFQGHIPPGCGSVGSSSFHRPAGSSRNGHHLYGFVEMMKGSCLQVMVSDYPCGEPLLLANNLSEM